jgi:DNA-binding GntR family transcriptional regulator
MVHQFTLALVRGGRALYLQIAAGLTSEIERGRLRSGDRLPSSRALAEQLDGKVPA